jgi:hypothetical protein
VIIIDESGSMGPLVDDTIGGVNTFLKEQKKVKGKATVTLVKFANTVEYIHENENLKNVRPLGRNDYSPGGGTALLKAMDQTIEDTGKFLAGLPEHERPAKVVVLTVTDGQENASGYPYSKARISQKINHQRDNYKWEFVFLGANQDAIQEGQSLGFMASHAMNYAASAIGTRALYKTLSNKVELSRGIKGSSLGTMAFTSDERAKAMNPDDATVTTS